MTRPISTSVFKDGAAVAQKRAYKLLEQGLPQGRLCPAYLNSMDGT
jgi:hypothetical protein